MNPKELLTHADFVRALARRLVKDEHRATDIEQETWLAALEYPPARGGSVRSWLYKVTRNFARILYRSEARRTVREREAALGRRIPTPEEIAVREEARRRMVEAVLALDEPFRTAILLHFYENRPVREMARDLGVPLATVKTRIWRGLKRLKERLVREYDGDRKPWILALAPFAAMNLALPTASAAAGSGATALPGVLAMSAKLKIVKIAAACALVLCVGAGLIAVLWDEPEAVKPVDEVVSTIAGKNPQLDPTLKAPISEIADQPGEGESKDSAKEVVPLKPSSERYSISGTVRTYEGKQPVPHAEVFGLFYDVSASAWDAIQTRCDEEGKYRLCGMPEETRIFLCARADGFGVRKIFTTVRRRDQDRVSFSLFPGSRIIGLAKDEQGAPVEDFSLQLYPFNNLERENQHKILSPDLYPPDEMRFHRVERFPGGRFAIHDVDQGSFRLVGSAPGYAVCTVQPVKGCASSPPQGVRQAAAEPSEVELFFRQGGAAVAGRVVEEEGGKPLSGRTVRLCSTQFIQERVSDEKGAFLFSALPAGGYALQAEPIADRHLLARVMEIELADGEQRQGLMLSYTEGLRLEGRVLDHDTAAPLPGLLLRVQNQSEISGGVRDRQARSDETGRFVFEGPFEAGKYFFSHVREEHPRKETRIVEQAVDEKNCANLVLRVRLTPRISGRILGTDGIPVQGALVLLVPAEPAYLVKTQDTTTSDKEGIFEFWDLDPGVYRLYARWKSDVRSNWTDPFAIDDARSVQGLTLVLKRGITIKGTIRDEASAPVPDVLITCWPLNEQGRIGDDRPVQGRSDPSGGYCLENAREGRARLSVSMKGYRQYSEALTLAAGVLEIHKDIVLEKPGVISGLVIDSLGKPVTRVRLTCEPIEGGEPLTADPKEDGRFRIDVKPGTYRLILSPTALPHGDNITSIGGGQGEGKQDDRSSKENSLVVENVAAGTTGLALVFDHPIPEAVYVVKGTVFDARTKAPVYQCNVHYSYQVVDPATGRTIGTGGNVYTEPDGTFEFSASQSSIKMLLVMHDDFLTKTIGGFEVGPGGLKDDIRIFLERKK